MEKIKFENEPRTVRLVGAVCEWISPDERVHRWASNVIDRTDGKVKVLELGLTAFKQLGNIVRGQCISNKDRLCRGYDCGKPLEVEWSYCPYCGEEAPLMDVRHPGGRRGLEISISLGEIEGFETRVPVVKLVDETTLTEDEIELIMREKHDLKKWRHDKDEHYKEVVGT